MYPIFYQALSLSTLERGNLYLLTLFKGLGYAGGILVNLAHSISTCSLSWIRTYVVFRPSGVTSLFKPR
jgi:hypothetical protein